MGVDKEVIKPGDGKLIEVTLSGDLHNTGRSGGAGQGCHQRRSGLKPGPARENGVRVITQMTAKDAEGRRMTV